jgi:hypothetical protein
LFLDIPLTLGDTRVLTWLTDGNRPASATRQPRATSCGKDEKMYSHIRTGAPLAAAWATLALAAASGDAQVVINEVQYDESNADGSQAADRREFVELFNSGAVAIDLGGWSLGFQDEDGVPLTLNFTPGSIVNPGDYYVVGQAGVPNLDLEVLNPGGFLEDDMETVELRNPKLDARRRGDLRSEQGYLLDDPMDLGRGAGHLVESFEREFWPSRYGFDVAGAIHRWSQHEQQRP